MRALAVLLILTLAGCVDGTDPVATSDCEPPCAAAPEAGLYGVVVDEAVTPIDGATVSLQAAGPATTTDAEGSFVFEDLEPGTYIVTASHPLYAEVQTTTTVAAGDPTYLKLQLTRTVFDTPYTSQQEVAGYLFCSSNAGGVIAEECGEGAGIPCEAPVAGPVPILGCQRVGGNPDNLPEARFFADGGLVRTIQAEILWEPTLTVGSGVQEGDFTAIMTTDFVCDPVCRYAEKLDEKVGGSPLIMRTDDGEQGTDAYFPEPDKPLADANITGETPVSVFVWTSDQDLAAVTVDQPFTAYVTIAYVLPLPEDWTFYEDGDPPF